MHDEVKRYSMSGVASVDANIVSMKESMLNFMETQARNEGYVPVLDMEPHFTREYNPALEQYDFSVSMYITYVGRSEACKISGIMNGKKIMNYIPQVK